MKATSDWIWTTNQGRIVAWSVFVIAVAAAWTVKSGGLRQPGVVVWPPGRWMLGWAPSFFAAFGFPFLWPALRLRSVRRWIRVDYVPECLAAALMLTTGEIFDGLFPKIGNTAPQTFAVADIVAILVGAALAFAFFRWLAGKDKSFARETSHRYAPVVGRLGLKKRRSSTRSSRDQSDT